MTDALNKDQVQADTQAWLEKAVIGLNLCPFAKAVQVQGKLRYVVSRAETVEALIYDLGRELNALHDADPEQVETTLLIHPQVLTDFLDYNDFLDAADALVEELGLAQATISQHLKELKNVGIIQGTVEGTSVCYCINPQVWQGYKKELDSLFVAYKGGGSCC